MQKASITTSTYDYGDGFMVDIIEDSTGFEAWLYHNDYGIKSLMFGVKRDYAISSINEFLAMVEANLENDNYIDCYADDYMD